ncbi:MAG TPA: cyanophycinase [Candidatus Ozemobacteraceae bacterium]|nr:cyanophycinase [Candidatus Ozemobacteraceae bacterium]
MNSQLVVRRYLSGFVLVILLFLWLVPLPAATDAETRTPPLQQGTLVLIGGALAAPGDEILNALKRSVTGLCRREGRHVPRVAFVPSSKQSLQQAHDDFEQDDPDEPQRYPSYRTWFERAGFEPLLVPITQETVFDRRKAAEDARLADLIRSCQVVFLMGGDQGKHAMCLLRRDGSPSAAMMAIREVYERGGAVVGTSAGTHAMANPMFGWGESGLTILFSRLEPFTLSDLTPKLPVEPKREGNCASVPGLGLLPSGMLTDTHFDARGRLGRLLVGLRDLGLRWGIGVDENTALFLQNGRGVVHGERGVFIVDTASATFSLPGEPFQARQVRVSLLTQGDIWQTTTGTIETSKPVVQNVAGAARFSSDVFSATKTSSGDRARPYETTLVMRSLGASADREVVARAWPPTASIWVRFRKTTDTRVWGSALNSTIAHLVLDVDRIPFFKEHTSEP